MSVKLRRRVCQILLANTGNPRICGSDCGTTSATLTYKWLVRGGSGQFQLKKLKKQIGSVGAATSSQLATVCNDLLDTVMERTPLEEPNRALLSH